MRRLFSLAISLLMMVALLAFPGCYSSDSDNDSTTTTIPILKLPIGSDEVYGKNYKVLIDLFESQGFTNINVDPIDDLIVGWLTKDGDVEEVAINGNTNFVKGNEARASDKIVIRYHTFPEEESSTAKKDPINVIPAGAEVKQINDKWGLYQGDKLVDNFTGIASNEFGKWYITNGLVDFNKNDVITIDGEQFQIKSGKVQMANYSVETAKKVVIVAFTNWSSEDVWNDEGSEMVPAKFHNYSENYSGKWKAYNWGTWSGVGNVWHNDRLELIDVYGKHWILTMDIINDGSVYRIRNVKHDKANNQYDTITFWDDEKCFDITSNLIQ